MTDVPEMVSVFGSIYCVQCSDALAGDLFIENTTLPHYSLNTHETVFFCFSSVINFPIITFILKNAGLKVITKNNNRLRSYYGKINDLRNRKQYGLMSI